MGKNVHEIIYIFNMEQSFRKLFTRYRQTNNLMCVKILHAKYYDRMIYQIKNLLAVKKLSIEHDFREFYYLTWNAVLLSLNEVGAHGSEEKFSKILFRINRNLVYSRLFSKSKSENMNYSDNDDVNDKFNIDEKDEIINEIKNKQDRKIIYDFIATLPKKLRKIARVYYLHKKTLLTFVKKKKLQEVQLNMI